MKNMRKTRDKFLRYVNVNEDMERIFLMTDSSFDNYHWMEIQLGFFILLVEDILNANLIQYRSSRCHWVTRSVMEAEINILVLGFDFEFIVKHMLAEIKGQKLGIEEMLENKTVFDFRD